MTDIVLVETIARLLMAQYCVEPAKAFHEAYHLCIGLGAEAYHPQAVFRVIQRLERDLEDGQI